VVIPALAPRIGVVALVLAVVAVERVAMAVPPRVDRRSTARVALVLAPTGAFTETSGLVTTGAAAVLACTVLAVAAVAAVAAATVVQMRTARAAAAAVVVAAVLSAPELAVGAQGAASGWWRWTPTYKFMIRCLAAGVAVQVAPAVKVARANPVVPVVPVATVMAALERVDVAAMAVMAATVVPVAVAAAVMLQRCFVSADN
jgi:hypothetical protein